MSSDSTQEIYTNPAGPSTNISGQVTVAAVVLIFIVFILTLVFYLRSKGYSGATGSYRSRRLVFVPHEPTLARSPLDPSILGSLPITIFKLKEFEEDGCLECAVCLSELADDEEVRLLPKCKHGFHLECIDMWFHSNNTCPLCRSLVSSGEDTTDSQTSTEIIPVVKTKCPSNDSNEASSSYESSSSSSSSSSRKRKEGMLVIDIPTRTVGALSLANTPLASNKVPSNSPLPTSRLLEEIKSPVFGTMRSFKRMLSRGSFKGVGSSYSPIGCDIEQGGLSESKCQ